MSHERLRACQKKHQVHPVGGAPNIQTMAVVGNIQDHHGPVKLARYSLSPKNCF